MALHAGCSQSTWIGVNGVTDLGASPGQMSVIPDGTAVVGEVIIQTFGAIYVGMLMLLAFSICREHVDICRNVVHLQMKWVGAWWKEAFPQCVIAFP